VIGVEVHPFGKTFIKKISIGENENISNETRRLLNSKGGLTTTFLQFVVTTATSQICSQLQLLLLLNKGSSLLTTATA
jgi:hypothetical protein